MNIMTVILVFTMAWWILFFIALPIGIQIEKKPGKGHASSAPKEVFLGKKLIITTLLAIVITALYAFLNTKGYLDFLSPLQ